MPCFFAVRVLAQTESKFASVGRFSGVSSTEAKKTKPKIQKIKIDARRSGEILCRQARKQSGQSQSLTPSFGLIGNVDPRKILA
jgi:hypothetical protein